MTRAEIEQQYKVVDGRIQSPGKFEGEPLYVPYFWDAYLDGWADEDDGIALWFNVTLGDVEEFPELAGAERVGLYCSEDGFVRGVTE